jgi:cytochrome P450
MAGGDFWSAVTAQRKAMCDEIRDAGPVLVDNGIHNGIYHLTRRADVVAAFHNPEVFCSRPRAAFIGLDVIDLPLILNGLNPPEHTRYRSALQPLFSPGQLKALVPELTRHAAAVVDAVAADGRCDAMSAVAFPYAVAGLHAFCGVPMEDAEILAQWKYTRYAEPRGSAAYLAAVFGLFGYLSAAIGERRQNPNVPGALGRLPHLMSDADAVAASYFIFGSGAVDEVKVAGWAFAALAGDPRLRRLLCANPGQTKVFVEEILRLEPPVSGTSRETTEDVVVGGVTIPRGSAVALCQKVINREDGANDISVTDGRIVRHRHWSYGAGPHRCPAANFVRLELTVLVNEWLRRIPDFELDEPIPDIPPTSTRLPSLPLRWDVTALPVLHGGGPAA